MPTPASKCHTTRKAAKRARYAAESAVPVAGHQAKRLARRMKRIQDLLGEHQDTVTTRVVLRELASAASSEGENAYTFGVLDGVQAARGRALRAKLPVAVRAAQQPKVRAWCS